MTNLILILTLTFGPFILFSFYVAHNEIKQNNKPVDKPEFLYVIALCKKDDITTKFYEFDKVDSYETAKYLLTSKMNGWGNAIHELRENSARIDQGWLVIEKIENK